MPFETFNAAITTNVPAKTPVAYLARTSVPNVALLDTLTPNVLVDFCAYRSHVVTGGSDHTDTRRRLRRVYVYGTGTINVGMIIFSADGVVTESYPYSPAGSDARNGILIVQESVGLQFRKVDITVLLIGRGIIVERIEVQPTIIG